MKKVLFLVALLAGLCSTTSLAAPLDTWILPVDQTVGSGWTTYAGAGYDGSDAYGASGMDGARRIYWALDESTIPTTTELYTIEFFCPTAGNLAWQPIESRFNGASGESYPIDTDIPWAGQYGTNHQYIYAEGTPSNRGTWVSTGSGPQTPESADYTADGSGIYMWLSQGSWLYAKWDFSWSIDNTWSAPRITQVTSNGVIPGPGPEPVPEPATMLLLASGLVGIAGFRKKFRKS